MLLLFPLQLVLQLFLVLQAPSVQVLSVLRTADTLFIYLRLRSDDMYSEGTGLGHVRALSGVQNYVPLLWAQRT